MKRDIKIFVSHSSKDKVLVDLFVHDILRLGSGMSEEEIFYTSCEGMDIKSGDDFRSAIRDALISAELTILIITPNYKASEVCLNEMGAAWVLGKKVVPLIVDPIDYESVGVLMRPKQIGFLNNKGVLNKLHDDILETFSKTKKTAIWDGHKETFISELEGRLKTTPFEPSRSKKEFDTLQKNFTDMKAALIELTREYQHLEDRFEKLKAAKSPEDVKAAEDLYKDTKLIDEFKSLNLDVKRALKQMSTAVASIILCEYFDQPYEIDTQGYKAALDEGVRRKFIYHDGDQFQIHESNERVTTLRNALGAVREFMDKLNSGKEDKKRTEFIEQCKAIYKSDLSCDGQDYWEEHFEFRLASSR